MPARRGHGWWPYWFPFFGFLLLVQASGSFPEYPGLFLLLKVAVPLGLFVFYWTRGSYPELRGYPDGPGGVAADVGVGLLGAALWVAPPILIDAMLEVVNAQRHQLKRTDSRQRRHIDDPSQGRLFAEAW